jgi:hypothetical protein
MECREIKRYLALYLDSELGPETTFEISSHLGDCTSCRRIAEQEERLEIGIKDTLMHPGAEDEELWKTAIKRSIPSTTRRSRLFRMPYLYAAAAACLAIISFAWHPWSHGELDLAAAVTTEHEGALRRPEHSFRIPGDVDALESYFQESLSPDFSLNVVEASFAGGGLCDLNGVKTAHLVWEHSGEPISVFWFASADLSAFPEATARMAREGPAIHCRVEQFEFYALRTASGTFIGVGEVSSTELQKLLDGFARPN